MSSFRAVCAAVAAIVSAAAIFAASPLRAQQIIQPPVVSIKDQNGVNLADGLYTLPGLEIGIGANGSGLYRAINGTADNFSGISQISLKVYQYTAGPLVDDVSLFGNVYRFIIGGGSSDATATVVAGPYSQVNGGNATLSCNGTMSTRYKDGTCTLTLADGTLAIYDQTLQSGAGWGLVTSVTKPSGEILSIQYYTSGNAALGIKSVSSSLGWMLKYDIDGSNRLVKVTGINTAVNYCDPAAASCSVNSSFPYTTLTVSGSTTSISKNGIPTVSYTVNGNTTTISSPDGLTKTVVQDGTTHRVSSVTVGGQTWSYAYNFTDTDHMTTVTAPNLTTRVVHTNSSGVTEVQDEYGRTTIYGYSGSTFISSGHIVSMSKDGITTSYGYDGRGNITTKTIIPRGAGSDSSQYLVTTAVYPTTCDNIKTCNKPTSIKDPAGVTTSYTYDVNGNLLSETTPTVNGVQAQTRYSYLQYTPHLKNASGVLVAQPAVWRLTGTSSCMTANLNACANANSTDEIKSSISYTSTNLLPYTYTTMRGDGSYPQTTTLTYDDNGNVIVTDGPKSGSVDETYYFYDSLNRQIGSVGTDPDASGSRLRTATRTDYDSDGRISNSSIGTVATSVYSGGTPAARNSQAYNDWQAMSVQSNDTTSYNGPGGLPDVARHYDNGTLTHLTQTNYDNLLRVNCVAQRLNPSVFGSISSTDACALGTAGPDGSDRIVQYGYDKANTVVSTTSGIGTAGPRRDYLKAFDPTSGTLQSVTDGNGNRTAYYYDTFDRLKETCYPTPTNGSTTNTSDCDQTIYAANGRVDHIVRRDGQIVYFGYDTAGRMNAKSGAVSESFTYDNFGDMVSHTNNGVTSTYAYLSNGWLSSETEPKGTVSYGYDAYGKRIRLTWPDGFYVTYGYDDGDELTGIYENGSTALVTFDYDNYGRRAHMYRANGQTTTYSYDTSSHLTGIAQGSANTVSLAYTAADQIKTRSNSNGSFTYTPPATSNSYGIDGLNRITTFNGTNLSYSDNRGNLTSDGSGTYAYNVKNLLTSATQSGVAATLAYDAEDRLYSLSKSGTNTQFLYDGDDMIAEYNGSTLLRRYVFSPDSDEPLIWYETSGTGDKRFLMSDNLGSITSVTNSTGSTLDINTYSAYGLMTSSNPAYAGRFAYTGQMWLPEIGMYNYKARLYHPIIGRFMQTDPIGYGDGMNWYAYVHDDPINGTDPSGNETVVTVVGQTCPSGATCYGSDQVFGMGSDNIGQRVSDGLMQLIQAYHDWNTPSDPGQCLADKAAGGIVGAGIGGVAGGTAAAGLEVTTEIGSGGTATLAVAATTPGAIAGGATVGSAVGATAGGAVAGAVSASCHNGGSGGGGANGGGEKKPSSGLKSNPDYPQGFQSQKATKVNINNAGLLQKLRGFGGSGWKKVYNDGFLNGEKVSVHYFQDNSGRVWDVKIRQGWSVP